MAEEAVVQTEFVETPEYKAAVDKAITPDQLREAFWEEAGKQGFQVPEKYSKFAAPQTEAAAAVADDGVVKTDKVEEPKADDADQVYHDEIVLGGKTYRFEGDSPADVFRQIKAAVTAHEDAVTPEAKPAPAKKEMTADDKVALELEYKMGKISLDEYLDKSGVLDKYWEKRGVTPEQLKEVVERRISEKVADAWEPAVEQFLTNNPDYEGNPQNEKLLKYKMAELYPADKSGKVNITPGVEPLQKAFDALKADGFKFKAPETKVEPKVEPKKKSSGLFGVGVGDDRRTTTTADANMPKITDKMTSREINQLFIDYYKSQGMNPDDAFKAAIKAGKKAQG